MHGGELIPDSIFVYGIPTDTKEDELNQFFVEQTGAGIIKDVKIITDPRGIPKGYGFVSFMNEIEVYKILDLKNGADKVEIQFKNTKLSLSSAFKQKRGHHTNNMHNNSNANHDGTNRLYLSPNSESIMPIKQEINNKNNLNTQPVNASNNNNVDNMLANELNDMKLSTSPSASTSPESHNQNDNHASTTSCSSTSILLDNSNSVKNEANTNALYTSESSSSSTTNLVQQQQQQQQQQHHHHEAKLENNNDTNSGYKNSNYKYKYGQYKNSNNIRASHFNNRNNVNNNNNNQNELHVQTYQNINNHGPFSTNSLTKQHYVAIQHQANPMRPFYFAASVAQASGALNSSESTAFSLVSPQQYKPKTNGSNFNKRNFRNNDKPNTNNSYVGSILNTVGSATKSQSQTPNQQNDANNSSNSSTTSSTNQSANSTTNNENNNTNSNTNNNSLAVSAIAANYANHSASINSSSLVNPQQSQTQQSIYQPPQLNQAYGSNMYTGDYYGNQMQSQMQVQSQIQQQQPGQQYAVQASAIYPHSYYYLANQHTGSLNTAVQNNILVDTQSNARANTGSIIPLAYQQQQQLSSGYYSIQQQQIQGAPVTPNQNITPTNNTTGSNTNNDNCNSTIKNALDTVISNSSNSISTEQYNNQTLNSNNNNNNADTYKNYVAYQQQPTYYYLTQSYTGAPIATPLHLNTATGQYYYYPQGPLSAGAQPQALPHQAQAQQAALQLVSGPLSNNSSVMHALVNPMTNQIAFSQQSGQKIQTTNLEPQQQQQSGMSLVSPRSANYQNQTIYNQQQAVNLINQYGQQQAKLTPTQIATNTNVPILQLPNLNYQFSQQQQTSNMIQSPQQHASALQMQYGQQQNSYYLQQQVQAGAHLTPNSTLKHLNKTDNNNNNLNRMNNNQRILKNGNNSGGQNHHYNNKNPRFNNNNNNRQNNNYISNNKLTHKNSGLMTPNEMQSHNDTSSDEHMGGVRFQESVNNNIEASN